MTTFGVHSEVGNLRKVMVHRPELSLQRLTPSNHDDLLFDDVLWVERAQYEHDRFVEVMRERGVEVFLLRDLLAEAMAASEEGRQRLIELAASEYTVGVSLVDEVRALLSAMKPEDLARHLDHQRAHDGARPEAPAGLGHGDVHDGLPDRDGPQQPHVGGPHHDGRLPVGVRRGGGLPAPDGGPELRAHPTEPLRHWGDVTARDDRDCRGTGAARRCNGARSRTM